MPVYAAEETCKATNRFFEKFHNLLLDDLDLAQAHLETQCHIDTTKDATCNYAWAQFWWARNNNANRDKLWCIYLAQTRNEDDLCIRQRREKIQATIDTKACPKRKPSAKNEVQKYPAPQPGPPPADPTKAKNPDPIDTTDTDRSPADPTKAKKPDPVEPPTDTDRSPADPPVAKKPDPVEPPTDIDRSPADPPVAKKPDPVLPIDFQDLRPKFSQRTGFGSLIAGITLTAASIIPLGICIGTQLCGNPQIHNTEMWQASSIGFAAGLGFGMLASGIQHDKVWLIGTGVLGYVGAIAAGFACGLTGYWPSLSPFNPSILGISIPGSTTVFGLTLIISGGIAVARD